MRYDENVVSAWGGGRGVFVISHIEYGGKLSSLYVYIYIYALLNFRDAF